MRHWIICLVVISMALLVDCGNYFEDGGLVPEVAVTPPEISLNGHYHKTGHILVTQGVAFYEDGIHDLMITYGSALKIDNGYIAHLNPSFSWSNTGPNILCSANYWITYLDGTASGTMHIDANNIFFRWGSYYGPNEVAFACSGDSVTFYSGRLNLSDTSYVEETYEFNKHSDWTSASSRPDPYDYNSCR